MTGYDTVKAKYTGHWENVQDDCLLCEMEKRTKWYIETPDWVVAEKLQGGPFVVYKRHKKELSDEEWERMEHIVGLIFDEFDIQVMMNLVKDHWHGHIVEPGTTRDLSTE